MPSSRFLHFTLELSLHLLHSVVNLFPRFLHLKINLSLYLLHLTTRLSPRFLHFITRLSLRFLHFTTESLSPSVSQVTVNSSHDFYTSQSTLSLHLLHLTLSFPLPLDKMQHILYALQALKRSIVALFACVCTLVITLASMCLLSPSPRSILPPYVSPPTNGNLSLVWIYQAFNAAVSNMSSGGHQNGAVALAFIQTSSIWTMLAVLATVSAGILLVPTVIALVAPWSISAIIAILVALAFSIGVASISIYIHLRSAGGHSEQRGLLWGRGLFARRRPSRVHGDGEEDVEGDISVTRPVPNDDGSHVLPAHARPMLSVSGLTFLPPAPKASNGRLDPGKHPSNHQRSRHAPISLPSGIIYASLIGPGKKHSLLQRGETIPVVSERVADAGMATATWGKVRPDTPRAMSPGHEVSFSHPTAPHLPPLLAKEAKLMGKNKTLPTAPSGGGLDNHLSPLASVAGDHPAVSRQEQEEEVDGGW